MQIEEGIMIRSAGGTRKLKKNKDLNLLTQQEKHYEETIRADGYVDNSPLRSELTTYPQPLLPGQRKEEKGRIAQTSKDISPWVIHKQPPLDLCFANPPGSCVWITPRKNDLNWSKGVEGVVIGKEPLTQSCHFAITVKEEIG